MGECYKKEFKDIWLKAAVLGSLWGSVEIIIGSFFHNIRLPMAGTILAVLGIILLTAFGQNWGEKGLFWRAGLISAVMKSVSPSAILIGPMTGIFLEALLFELAVMIFGKNHFGFIIGGMIALYSVIIHKITSLLIIYGFDLVKILDNLYSFIVKQLNIENLNFLQAFLLISSIYLLLGLIASVFGIITGKKAGKNDLKKEPDKMILDGEKKDMFSTDESHGSVFMLLLHLMSIVLILAFTNLISLPIASLLTIIYVLYVLFKYKRAVRFFKRPWFWIQIALFIFISALFYNGFNKGYLFTEEGLIAGLKMGLRAVLIVIGFSAVSTELRNPFIKFFLYRKGFSQFYTASGLAFSVLPYIIKRSAKAKSILRNPIESLTSTMHDADQILNEFKELKLSLDVIIITGEKHSGKTTFAEKLIKILIDRNNIVKGFIAPGKFENSKRSEFYIKDVYTNESKLLCGINGGNDQKQIGRFYFNEEGLNFGKKILRTENIANTDFLIVDEIGPFELKGKGWSSSLDELLKKSQLKMIWVVRKSLVYDIIRRFGITDALIFDIEKDTPELTADHILKKIPAEARIDP